MTGSVKRYSGGAILLHWLIAFLLAGELALGFTMPRDASGFELFQLHKSIGITILLLSLVRLGWRFTHKRPAKMEGGVNGFLASAVHVGFYVLMIAVPLTGWALVSTAEFDVPTLIFGTVPWPHLPLPDSLGELFEESHEILAKVGLGLFVLHVVGALRHHFLMRDTLLSRMGPGGSGMAVLALMAAVVVLGATVFFSIGGEHEEDAVEPEVTLPDSGSETDGRVPLASPEEGPESAEDAEEPQAQVEDEVAVAVEAIAAAEPVAQVGPPPAWTIQPGGSLRFTIDNGGTALNGSFKRWSGNIVMNPEHPESAEISMRFELASASMGDATQDEMLVGGDFFSVAAHPTANWRATSVRRLGGNRYEADGTLTLKGASKPQKIAFTLAGTGARRSVSGSATINRNAFAVGVGSNAANLGPNVSVNFAFDATR